MKVAGVGFRAEGVVLVMHSDLGMGIAFTQTTDSQRNDLEKFIQALTNSNGTLPQLLVEPEGLETGEPAIPSAMIRQTLCWISFEKGPTLRPKPSRPNYANNAPQSRGAKASV